MRHIPLLLFGLVAMGTTLALIGCWKEHGATPEKLYVQIAAPARGFVCVPAITPKVGIVKRRELA